MRPEASLRRLAEMGIEVYVPRAASVVPSAPAPLGAGADAAIGVHGGTPPAAGSAGMLLFAELAGAGRLVADLVQALAFAGVPCSARNVDELAGLDDADGVIAIGPATARRIGAQLPAQRQAGMAWIVAADIATLRTDSVARGALWGQLKQLARRKSAPDAPRAGKA